MAYPLGPAETPPLLVASISEAMATRRSSGAVASTSQRNNAQGPVTACFREGGRCLLFASVSQSGLQQPQLALDASFKVQSRRQQQLAKQVQQFLSAASGMDHLNFMGRFAMGLFAAQQAVKAQLERTAGSWRPRNPFRRRSTDDPGPCGQQRRASRPAQQAQRLGELGLACERALQMEEAAQYFQRAAAADPTSPEWPARESKVWSDCGYLPGTGTERAFELNQLAVRLGQRAVEADPNSAFGWVALCVSRGRMAVVCRDNKQKVQLARLAQDDVKMALKLDPSNDLAHHLLGRWHYEMASVNAMVRTIIQMFYGTSLMAGSYREAALCFEAASQLRPDRLIHRVELGRTYLKLGNTAAGVSHLEAAMGLDVEDLNAQLQLQDAVGVLRRVKGAAAVPHPAVQRALPPPPPKQQQQ